MKNSAYNAAIKLLSKRDYSRFKLSEKLSSKGFSSTEIDEAVTLVIEKKFLQEDNYIAGRLRSLILKNYGHHYLEQKLLSEHLECNEQLIDHAYQDLGISPEQQIISIAEKKLRSISSDLSKIEKMGKLLTIIQNKGHSVSMAKPLVSLLIDS